MKKMLATYLFLVPLIASLSQQSLAQSTMDQLMLEESLDEIITETTPLPPKKKKGIKYPRSSYFPITPTTSNSHDAPDAFDHITTNATMEFSQPMQTYERIWSISPADMTILGGLRRWAREAGWQISWEVGVDFPLTLSAQFQGSFTDASTQLLEAFSQSDFPIQGCFYNVNQVLRITRYVTSDRNCE